jgi:hypothetical protein
MDKFIDLENIKWFIEEKPSEENVFFRDSDEKLNKEDLEKIVLNLATKIKLKFPLNDDYSAFKIIEISGKQTVLSLFLIIYDFYQRTIDEKDVEKIFKNYPDLYEELKEMKSEVKYVDVFDTDCGCPDFVGLTTEKNVKNMFTIDLGPL